VNRHIDVLSEEFFISLQKQSEEADRAAQIAAARVDNQKQKGRRNPGTRVSATEPEAALQKQKDSNKRLSWRVWNAL